MTGWGRQGPCLSQHGSVWLSPHSLPWQCQESETRAQSVSRPRMSGSLEGFHCAWCTKSMPVILQAWIRAWAESATLALTPTVSCCCRGVEGAATVQNFGGPCSKNCLERAHQKGKTFVFWLQNPLQFHSSIISPRLPYLPCCKTATVHQPHFGMIIFSLPFIITWKFIFA